MLAHLSPRVTWRTNFFLRLPEGSMAKGAARSQPPGKEGEGR